MRGQRCATTSRLTARARTHQRAPKAGASLAQNISQNRYHYALMKNLSSFEAVAAQLDELFKLVELLVHENRTLKTHLAHEKTLNHNLEKRLSAARLRIETLINKLPAA